MDTRAIVAFAGAGLSLALACGSESTPNTVSYGGAGPGGQGGAVGSTGAGPGGAGGFGALGGLGGGVNVGNGGGSTDANPDAPCQGFRQDVQTESLPVDIVWAIDTSGSMTEESIAVQENINAFSQSIIAANIDVHVVMIAGYPLCFGTLCIPLPGICVGAPLGTGQCPADSKPPNFFHHQTAVVQSQDGAVVLINQFPSYRQMLRPTSLKYLVVVTDDDSTGEDAETYADNPDKFIADYTALDPMMQNATGDPSWKMSGIYAQTQCPNAARMGNFWKAVIDKTGGVHGDICSCPAGQQAACTQTFKTVLDSLAKTIVTAAKPLECEYPIPAPPAGETFDKDKVNINLTNAGITEDIYWVNDATACHPELGGWYYDDNTNPTRILTCPKSCEKIKATTSGNIAVALGCKKKEIPIAQ
jgi:hypothetical protein